MKGISMNTVNKITLVIAKIAEVMCWIAAVSMVVLLVCSVAAKDLLNNILSSNIDIGAELSSFGFEISVVNIDGSINAAAVTIFSIAAAILLSLFAMAYRNIYLILKTAMGKTWFSKGDTPFQKDIVRMLREIGIFLIAVPVVGLIMSTVAHAVIADAETSIRCGSAFFGLLVLCLSQFFAYGTELQKDVDGLL